MGRRLARHRSRAGQPRHPISSVVAPARTVGGVGDHRHGPGRLAVAAILQPHRRQLLPGPLRPTRLVGSVHPRSRPDRATSRPARSCSRPVPERSGSHPRHLLVDQRVLRVLADRRRPARRSLSRTGFCHPDLGAARRVRSTPDPEPPPGPAERPGSAARPCSTRFPRGHLRPGEHPGQLRRLRGRPRLPVAPPGLVVGTPHPPAGDRDPHRDPRSGAQLGVGRGSGRDLRCLGCRPPRSRPSRADARAKRRSPARH